MKMQAAIVTEFGKPLVIDDMSLSLVRVRC
jgi:hypothetical protein